MKNFDPLEDMSLDIESRHGPLRDAWSSAHLDGVATKLLSYMAEQPDRWLPASHLMDAASPAALYSTVLGSLRKMYRLELIEQNNGGDKMRYRITTQGLMRFHAGTLPW